VPFCGYSAGNPLPATFATQSVEIEFLVTDRVEHGFGGVGCFGLITSALEQQTKRREHVRLIVRYESSRNLGCCCIQNLPPGTLVTST